MGINHNYPQTVSQEFTLYRQAAKLGIPEKKKKKISSRNTKHEKVVFKGQVEDDALAESKQTCECKIDWNQTKTLAIEPIFFPRN